MKMTEAERIALRDRLIAAAEKGAIKFEPFTQDITNGRWDAEITGDTYEWALSIAQIWHWKVIAQMKAAGCLKGAGGLTIMRPGWNHAVPYCRNIPTREMIREAGL